MALTPFRKVNGQKLPTEMSNPLIPFLRPRPKSYVCKAGHEVSTGDAPYKVALPFGTNQRGEPQQLNSGPVCPICFLTWLGEQFPLVEKADA